jgi:hypothetical protein
MAEETLTASAHGFLLGLQIAEQLNGLSLGSTLAKQDELIDLILGLAEGKPFLNDNAAVIESLPGSADLEFKRASLKLAMEDTAEQVIEWYRRQCMQM